MTHSITVKHAEFDIAISSGPKSKFKGVPGGFRVNLAEIPQNVLADFIEKGLAAYLREGLKSLEPEANTEQCQAAMKYRYDQLVHGRAETKKRTQSLNAKLRSAARASLRNRLIERIPGELDADGKKEITRRVSLMFEQYDAYVKTKDERYEKIARQVQLALNAAKAQHEAMEELGANLGELLGAGASTENLNPPKAPIRGPAKKKPAQPAA